MRTRAQITLLLIVLGALALVPAHAGAEEGGAPPVTSVPAPPAEAPLPTETTPPTETPAPAAEAQAEGGAAEGGAAEAPPAEVQGQSSQGASEGTSGQQPGKGKQGGAGSGEHTSEAGGGVRAKHKAASPSALTPLLPGSLGGSIAGIPSFFIESFQVPPFLLPIFQAAGAAYDIPWQVLAAINEVETDYGRDLSVSSAGAEGWMQFLPSSWAQYGVDANGDGFRDPYNPADAIFAAARYLHAAGGSSDVRSAVFAYNHSQAYVGSVMLRAQLLGGMPSELLGAVTGLTEARFPVHAAAHFSDGFPGSKGGEIAGTTIYSEAGAPVIAVQDGQIVQVGRSPSLGRFVALRDAYGNTYVYARLGEVSSVYPVLEPHVNSTPSPQATQGAEQEKPPSAPATAGVQPRSPLSEAGTVSGLALGSAAGLESAQPPAPAQPPAGATPPSGSQSAPASTPQTIAPHVSAFREGVNEVYLHPLAVGAQVLAGTVLGHVGGDEGAEGRIVFQVRPAGANAPLIDPKPILDGWVSLENSSVFHAQGENPFLATSPTVGQVLLESKQQLQRQVLKDGGIELGRCGRQDVQEGRVEVRVLATLEYLSVSGLRPSVGGLRCEPKTPVAQASNASAAATSATVTITAINGVPVAGHQSQGSLADTAERKLLMLQGLSRPRRIVSALSFPGAPGARTNPKATAIEVAFAAPRSGLAKVAGLYAGALAPQQWTRLVARLGQIPDPSVSSRPSAAALPDTNSEGGARGNH